GRGPACDRSSHRTGAGRRGARSGAPATAALLRPGVRPGLQRLLAPSGLQSAPPRPGARRAPGQLSGARHLHGARAAMTHSHTTQMVTPPPRSTVEPAGRLGDTARRLFSSKEAFSLPTLS